MPVSLTRPVWDTLAPDWKKRMFVRTRKTFRKLIPLSKFHQIHNLTPILPVVIISLLQPGHLAVVLPLPQSSRLLLLQLSPTL